MLISLLLLAQADSLPIGPKAGHGSSLRLGDSLTIVGVGVAMAAVLFLIVFLTRKKREGNSHAPSSRVLVSSDHRSHDGTGRVRIKKKRRRHPDNLPRNPTLGETGGLPPVRSEDSVDPVD